MKKSVYKPGTLLLSVIILSGLSLSAQELNKEYHKEYDAQGKSLSLSNRYGDVVVETSQTDKVIIDVKVTLKYPNQERAEKLLSYIDVQFSEDANVIAAETNIDDKFNFSGWVGDSRRFSIDYNVKMPVNMDLELENRYGNTDLDDLSGLVNLDIKYGNLTVSNLLRGDDKPISTVSIAYGKGTIEEAGWLDASIRYSGNFTINKAKALLIDSKYSTLNIGSASSIVSETKYDKFKVENINNLVIEAGYADVKIGTIGKKLVLDGGYGSFNVERVPAGFESIEITSKYMGVNVGIDESADYNLDGRVSYGGLKFNEDNYTNKRRIVENTSTEISGVVGKNESPSSSVKVSASYGTVKLY